MISKSSKEIAQTAKHDTSSFVLVAEQFVLHRNEPLPCTISQLKLPQRIIACDLKDHCLNFLYITAESSPQFSTSVADCLACIE